MQNNPLPSVFIFDLFGVVISFDDQLVYRRISEHCPRPDAAMVVLDDLVSHPQLITSQISLVDIHNYVVEVCAYSKSYNDFMSHWLEPYTDSMDGMSEILQGLASRYPLVLLSNVDAAYWATMSSRHPELSYFHHRLVSCEIGVAKPDAEAFRQAADVAGVEPSVCLFVDDKLENIEAARSLGFQTHLFTGVPELKAALKASGVFVYG